MNIIGNEVYYLAAGSILAANIFATILFTLFARLPESKLKESIRKIIYTLDHVADNMENAQKRAEAIRQAQDLLGWKRILIPSTLIGWLIDAEVAAIRKMQRATNCPNLHNEEGAE